MLSKVKRILNWNTQTALPIRWTAVTLTSVILTSVIMTVFLVLIVPKLLVPARSDASLSQVQDAAKRHELEDARLKLQNDLRATLLQGLAGVAVLTGAFFTYRQVQTGRQQLLTERFTRAIDQLGHKEIDVRIGGVYSLARIAKDSSTDRATVADVLAAYVRNHSPWPPTRSGQYVANAPINQVPMMARRAPDIQSALTALARGLSFQDDDSRLDLAYTDLRKANLRSAQFEQTYLIGTHLEKALLVGADLADSAFERADLQGAQLVRANLRKARFDGAHLENADLRGAHLEDTDFRGAHLEDTDFRGAHVNSQTMWPKGFDWQAAVEKN
jgi:hypothetical protein